MEPARTDVLGVGVSAINLPMALEIIRRWIADGQSHYVCVTGVHGIMESQKDADLRRIHNAAGLVTPDGMPLVWLSRMAGHEHVDRVYGPDLMLAACALSERTGYRHYLYGGADGVPERLADSLKERCPELSVVGTYSPPFRSLSPAEGIEVVDRINAARPDIVWVGLSTPKQERWMAAHVGRIQAPVMVGVGAAFDFLAGLKRQAPRWMQRGGLEWLFRMIAEPRRLGPRYLLNNPAFVWALVRSLLNSKRRMG